jgi:tRNA A-37 threonylcarbamoyl transferase component Bud32
MDWTAQQALPPPGVMERVDPLCDRFEDALEQGGWPNPQAYLDEAEPADRPALLEELLLLEWSYRVKRGDGPRRDQERLRFAALAGAVEAAWERWLSLSTVSAGADPAVPEALGQAGYDELTLLGEGGMGVVYRARDVRLKRRVALKMIRAGVLAPEGLARFRREAEALARLQHPHIVQLHAWEQFGGRPVLVLEYVPGGTLEERLARAVLAPAEAVRLVAILARAVQAAHEAGVVHRDLKPANVLMAPPLEGNSGTVLGGFPKVSDFGLARLGAREDGRTLEGELLGTPAYMAPEQARGDVAAVGPATDVWALGVVLYRCLTRHLPFAGDSVLDTLERVKSSPPAPLRPVQSEAVDRCWPELEAVCLRCLDKAPGQRPTAARLAELLEQLLAVPTQAEGVAPGTAPPSAPARPSATAAWAEVPPRQAKVYRWRGRLAGGLAVLVALIGLVLWLMTFTRNRQPDGPAPPAEAVGIKSFRVWHFAKVGGKSMERGEIGKDSMETKFDDGIRLEVELTKPEYLYLAAFNPDGKEQLLWPWDRADPRRGDVTARPGPVRRVVYPAGGDWLYLNDNKEGGLQALAVLASARPLPAYAKWVKVRGPAGWRKHPAGRGVWLADGEGLYPALEGRALLRDVRPPPGAPPLRALERRLRTGGVEVVEVLAFPVRKKEAE